MHRSFSVMTSLLSLRKTIPPFPCGCERKTKTLNIVKWVNHFMFCKWCLLVDMMSVVGGCILPSLPMAAGIDSSARWHTASSCSSSVISKPYRLFGLVVRWEISLCCEIKCSCLFIWCDWWCVWYTLYCVCWRWGMYSVSAAALLPVWNSYTLCGGNSVSLSLN